jgi:hypothetical protein
MQSESIRRGKSFVFPGRIFWDGIFNDRVQNGNR